MYIPNLGEIVIYICSLLGALIGFLWYNAFPAQIFMGDTGSLTIGAIISVIAIMVRKELLLPLLCGIFLIENWFWKKSLFNGSNSSSLSKKRYARE